MLRQNVPTASRFLGALFASIMTAALHMAPAGDDRTQQLRMYCEISGDTLSIRLVGSGSKAASLTYRLTLTGSSQTANAGRVRIVPGTETVVARVNQTIRGPWQAILDVSGDSNYRQVANSEDC